MKHPVHDDGPDYLVDPVSAASMISTLLQIVLSFVGPEKAKAALDWEIVQAANARADEARSEGRSLADSAFLSKFGSGT